MKGQVLPPSAGPEISSPRKRKDLISWTSLVLNALLMIVLVLSAFSSLYDHRYVEEEIEAARRNQKGQQQIMQGDDGEGLSPGKGAECKGRWIYVYELPREFNEDLVDRCRRATGEWVDMCGNLENGGYGPGANVEAAAMQLNDTEEEELVRQLKPARAWYRTEQFSLDVLVHRRMQRYPCLTEDPALASAFYIPYFGALDTAFTLFAPQLHLRDRLAQRLAGWLSGSPVWLRFGPPRRPHFMVLGRTSGEFRRSPDSLDGWGTSLSSIPELTLVLKLFIERNESTPYEVALPYPTSFHPTSDHEMRLWQDALLSQPRRPWLCTFVGSASRGTPASRSLRTELFAQCDRAPAGACRHVTCGYGALDCVKRPDHVTALFRSSIFCLQPTGDSPTRKGIFDSLLAGCIPVLFSKSSTYTQYMWHLPWNGSLYSLFFEADDVVEGRVDVISALARVANDTHRLRQMQEQIVHMLPNIVYSDPSNRSNISFLDALDVAVDSILDGSPMPLYS